MTTYNIYKCTFNLSNIDLYCIAKECNYKCLVWLDYYRKYFEEITTA